MEKQHNHQSALTVNSGIPQPPQVNPNAFENIRKNRKKKLSVKDYVDGILAGNISILSQAITLVESSLPHHHAIAQQVIEQCLPHTGNSIRIGITGVPGVGKSTLSAILTFEMLKNGDKVNIKD